MSVLVLIPAHNEQEVIADAIRSLQSQTIRPERIVVIADNCTDQTAEVASQLGVSVLVTSGNTDKKAGALNQALIEYIGTTDYVLTQDADTQIPNDWIENAIAAIERGDRTGAVSGKYQARNGPGLISMLQQIEYHQVHRRIARKKGKIAVLSGTATLFKTRVLAALYAQRGFFYDGRSLTEDFEITLALQQMGYQPRSYKSLPTTTDVMTTWKDLTSQRLRWQRGTLETLIQYGLNANTWRLWLGQVVSYGMTFVYLMMALAWGIIVGLRVTPEPLWLSIIPLFIAAQIAETRGLGAKRVALAASLVPMWLYDMYRLYIYWLALTKTIARSDRNWH